MSSDERTYQQLRRLAKRLDQRLYKFQGDFWLVDIETNGLIGQFCSPERVAEFLHYMESIHVTR